MLETIFFIVICLFGAYLFYFYIKSVWLSKNIRKEYKLIKANNFERARKKYPLAHLFAMDVDDEISRQIDRQLNKQLSYWDMLNENDLEKFKNKYRINDKYLESLDLESMHND